MGNSRLVGAEIDRLREAPLTYAEVGHTRGALPSGFHHLRYQVGIGSGSARFEEASRTLLTWSMHRRAGLEVRPSADLAVDGAVAVLRVGVRAVAIKAPVRVVYAVSDARRQGFAYGTLPGHPESGEEAFVVELQPDETVTFTITAFSRPATRLARLSGPGHRAAQNWFSRRYLRAMQP